MLTSGGIKVLDGSAYERDGVGFAGTKGFVGGFGRGVLTAFGEPEIKTFVRASIDEALKLERGLSQLRSPKRVVVLHYSPIAATVVGEAPEIYSYMGTSRLAEVIDRHGADLVLHGHAHHGTLEGQTTAGIPVRNVAITLLQAQTPPAPYRIFERLDLLADERDVSRSVPSNPWPVTCVTDHCFPKPHNRRSIMSSKGPIRKAVTAMLMLAIALWAEAGLALVAGDQVMECSMTMHRAQAMAAANEGASQAMPCCPEEQVHAPASKRPECCTNGDAAERPLGFVVSSERHTAQPLETVAEVAAGLAPQTAKVFGVWRSALASRYVKPILELKTDLRI